MSHLGSSQMITQPKLAEEPILDFFFFLKSEEIPHKTQP